MKDTENEDFHLCGIICASSEAQCSYEQMKREKKINEKMSTKSRFQLQACKGINLNHPKTSSLSVVALLSLMFLFLTDYRGFQN